MHDQQDCLEKNNSDHGRLSPDEKMMRVPEETVFCPMVRIIDAIAYWDQRLDAPIPFLLSLLFDSIKSSANPFVYLFVGNWKRKKIQEPNHIFLENALKYKENMTEPPQIDQKQASRHPRPQT
nr:uncharacterized protein LOC110087435 isoform X6 [Pogona vitticeps]